AQAEELRAAMARVRRRGKPVYAHGDSLGMRDYVLACGANRISVVPTGDIQIMGLYGESLYLRGLFDLLGIEPDFTTCGDYKSAAEMFTRYGPSEPARRNREWLMDSLYDTMVAQIAQGRGVSETMVKRWIDEGLYTAERAEKAGVIDAVEHRQDFVSFLKKTHGEDVRLDLRYGKKAKKEVDFSSPFGLLKFYAELLAPKKERSSRSSIAIVYVDGPIVPGSSSGGFLFGPERAAYSTPIRKALDRAAEDDSIKAVVLRIDSPGGSAVASEIILDATRRVKAKKPFVVSMGDVAGSGGYYVACAADTIYADRSTITASIGVVSGKLATKAMWRRFGVHFEATSRGRRAGMLLSSEPFTDGEKEQLQAWMNEVYEVFQGHVRASRGDRLKKDLAELAGGRVFTGAQAHKLGLVDRLGTLHDAIGYAAQLAKLEEGSYDVRVLPKPKSFFEVLFGEDLDEEKELELHMARPEVGSRLLEIWKRRDPAAARWLAGLQATDPARFAAVCEALRQVELFQSERVLLTMPSFFVW
ncbi:MAG TPA: signal peptide peptidase SppA, partial [Planctomycetaceae bacterium]|nr:signal peptide peptidase SppA [Planctomycetaceae bacterium]